MEIFEYLKAHTQDILKDIFYAVKIPSVATDGTDEKPYGEKCAEAIDYILSIAQREGLATRNFDYYAADATYGSSPEKLGILTHLDVVPAGEGWVFNPFFMTERDGKIYGRGVADDKGAAVMSVWALKAIKELNVPLKHGVRLVFGSGEEVGCKDLEYYMSKVKMPPYVFSPDASFPIINTEKGRYCGKFDAVYDAYVDGPQVIRFAGGSIVNVVPRICEAVIRGASEEALQKALKKFKRLSGIEAKFGFCGRDIKLTVEGKSAHASMPENGINAITAMLELIKLFPLKGKVFEYLKAINDIFPHGDFYGEKAGVQISDEISGKSTFSLNILNCEKGLVSGAFDARTSLNATYENTVAPLCDKFKERGIRLQSSDMMPAHHVDGESEFVKLLGKAYEKYTGNISECVSMGGITYVHNIENAVAFGPLMPDDDAHIHGANEFMVIDDIIKTTAIFAQAIIDICS